MTHYARDKGILAAYDYLGMHIDPIPMLRCSRTQGKPIARASTNRLLALCWIVTLAVKG